MVQKHSTQRRGMVLIIVLVLLSMVGLTAVTFLLTTGQLKDASEQNRKMGETTIDPDAMLQDAIMQVIRGTKFTSSPLYGNSLLEDMYGTSESAPIISCTINTSLEDGMAMLQCAGTVENVGRVITCVDSDSPSNGMSTVILKYTDGKYYCLPFPNGKTFESGNGQTSLDFIINEMPFQDTLDYDAIDDNNRFLAARDASTGEILVRSFHGASNLGDYGLVDADNDGHADASWLDLGSPIYTSENGTLFKPLFGFVIEDMDGKINVNAQGDTRDRSAGVGMGRGPAEIAWGKVFGTSTVESLYNNRLSANGTNGSSPDFLASTQHKGDWYEKFYSEISGTHVQRTPYDTLGVISYTVDSNGQPTFTSIDSNFPATPSTTTEMTANPYDLDLGQGYVSGIMYQSNGRVGTNDDMPFSPSELEALIRRYDFDAPFLPHRLADILNISNNPTYARLVTTESWDIPVIPENVLGTLNETTTLPEVLAGWPVDLLRAATFNAYDKWDGTKYPRRQMFMDTLYYILKQLEVDFGGSGETVQKRRAQWCANVVDFLDADSVMTPFKPEGEDFYVFGCEQPEVLITETFAMHSRNTETDVKLDDDIYIGGKKGKGPKSAKDTAVYENYPLGKYKYNGKDLEASVVKQIEENIKTMEKNGYGPDGEDDFDQYVRPQGALFVELYNSCTGETRRPKVTRNDDIYAVDSYGIDLTKKAGTDSVWRLVVMKDASTPESETDATNLKRDESTDENFSSSIYRVANLAPGTTCPEQGTVGTRYVHSAATAANSVTLDPGKALLVGPEGVTVFKFTDPGSETDATDPQNNGVSPESSIRLSGTTCTFTGLSQAPVQCLAIEPAEKDQTTEARFSLSEDGKYGQDKSDTNVFALDPNMYRDKPMDEDNYKQLGTNQTNRRMVHLQRLADPSRAHDSKTNPYITVDSMIVDLTVMNARTRESESGVTGTNPPAFVTRKRESKSNLLQQDDDSAATVTTTTAQNGLEHSFSKDTPFGTTQPNVTWLGWINRPPVSPFELMNVTNRTASDMLHCYNPDDSGTGFEKKYGYLPKFTESSARKVFGFLRVPSPQTVTPMVLNRNNMGETTDVVTDTLPFAYYSMYREPGKININTIPSAEIWSALLNRTVSSADFQRVSKWPTTSSSSTTTPFRSIAEAPDSSVLQDSNFNQLMNVTNENSLDPASRLNLYRLANLTTTRSNVFAVWVTMGFFEVNASGNVTTNELGETSGGVKRYRAFYLIDRSIPVGFERGINHNAENVILLRRMLQ